MPIYEYQCDKCGKVSEFLEAAKARAKHKCRHCDGDKMTKVISGFAVGVNTPGSSSKCHSCSDRGCPHANG